MAEVTTRDSEIHALRDEVRQLRRLVAEMDSDMAELEWHIEEMGRREGTHLYALSGLLLKVFGPRERGTGTHPDEWASYIWGALYPDAAGPAVEGGRDQPHGRYKGDGWRIPRRRWRQYGTREELVALAADHGIEPSRREGREWIVRRLGRVGVRPALRSEPGR